MQLHTVLRKKKSPGMLQTTEGKSAFVTLKRVGLSSKAPSFVSLNWEGML